MLLRDDLRARIPYSLPEFLRHLELGQLPAGFGNVPRARRAPQRERWLVEKVDRAGIHAEYPHHLPECVVQYLRQVEGLVPHARNGVERVQFAVATPDS